MRGGCGARVLKGSRAPVLGWICALLLASCGGGHSAPQIPVASVAPTISPRHSHPMQTIGPSLAHLRASLTREFTSAGPNTGAEVVDLGTGHVLFSLRANVRRPPASVEKIYTTVALDGEFGTGTRLHTTILGTGHLDSAGVWHGNLYLRGGGDPTFGDGGFNRVWEQGYGPTAAQLVSQLQAAGIHRVTGRVFGDESLFDARRGPPSSGFAPDIPDLGGELSALTYDHGGVTGKLSPAAFATHELVLTMRGMHIGAIASQTTRRTPPGARILAAVRSPAMSDLVRLMDVPSDDFFAEMLTKRLGARFGAAGSTAAGARVIASTIASYGVHPTIVDGSGLSRADRSSPNQVTHLLQQLWHTSAAAQLIGALPVVGVSGTTRRIAPGTAAQGRCSAKTGTLDNVTNLAGYCHSRGHHEIAFALFIDGPPNWTAIPLISQMVTSIVRY